MLKGKPLEDWLHHICDRYIANAARDYGLKEYQVAAIMNRRSK